MKKYLIVGIVALTMAFVAVSADAAIVRNLTVGSQGADVAELQAFLISRGHNIPAISSGVAAPGYFGSQTKAAVMAYQAANGIPNTGFFGPLTRASVNTALGSGGTTGGNVACPAGYVCTPVATTPVCPVGFVCTPVNGGTATPGNNGLSGVFGTVADVNLLSQYSNEDVGEGEGEVRVLGFEVEATNDGDILLRSLRISFDPSGNDGSTRLNRYIDSVTIWQGDEEIGRADVDEFTEGNNDVYSKTIILDNDTIVRRDTAEEFYVTVDAVRNLDSGDISGDSWTIDIDSIRFEDGSGVVTTISNVGDLDQMNVPINFVDFSTAADTRLRISLDSDSPSEGLVVIDGNSIEDDIVVLRGTIEVEGDSDVVIEELPITLEGSGVSDVDSIVGSLTLRIDGREYSESVSTSASSATVVFDRLRLTVEAGDTIDFVVLADINRFSGDFDAGDSLTASLTSTNRDNIDVENEQGDQLNTSNERSGTALGRAQVFRTEGISPTLSTGSNAPAARSNNADGADTGTFTIRFSVTATGENIYIASLANDAVDYVVYDSSGSATTSASMVASLQNVTDTTKTQVGNYLIEEGETETFLLTIIVPNGVGDASDLYRAVLTGINWDTSDDVSPSFTHTTGLDEFQTPTVFLDNN